MLVLYNKKNPLKNVPTATAHKHRHNNHKTPLNPSTQTRQNRKTLLTINPLPNPHSKRYLPLIKHAGISWSSYKNLWWYSWPIYWYVKIILIWRDTTLVIVFVSWWLCWSGETRNIMYMFVVCVEDSVSW